MIATDILMEEHRLIEVVLDSLETAAHQLEAEEEIDDEYFLHAAEFIAGFADGCHHSKEEDVLFPAMSEHTAAEGFGPVEMMLDEHEQARRYTQAFRSAAEQMLDGDVQASAELIDNVLAYIDLLREHIEKEDQVLYPMADQVLDGAAQLDVDTRVQELSTADKESGLHDRYRELAENLRRAVQQS